MAIDSRLRENDVSYMFRSHPREGGDPVCYNADVFQARKQLSAYGIKSVMTVM